MERLQTSKSRLQADWAKGWSTAEKVLSQEEAIRALRGDDPRPLLILRDCEGCPNKEGDLLARTILQERFLLATNWFHCVKLDHEVLNEDHALHAFFTDASPAHMVVASWDAEVIELVPRASRKGIWKAMTPVLKHDYKKNAETAVKSLTRLLDEFDVIDGREAALLDQIKRKEEQKKAIKVRKLRKDLEELQEKREKALEKEKKLRDLGLRHVDERDGLEKA